MRSEVLAMEVDAKKAEKRAYNRMKQRAFRKKIEDELQSLHRTIYDLELETTTLRRAATGPLPWADVAAALSKSTEATLHTNRALRSDVARARVLAQTMHAWVRRTIPHAPRERYFSMAPATLPASWEARQLGFKWITDRLYHHAEHLLHEHGLYKGEQNVTFGEITVHTTENGTHEYFTKYQRRVSAPFAAVCSAFEVLCTTGARDFVLSGRSALDAHITSLMDEEIVYSQGACTRDGAPWVDNKVWRTYRKPHELVIVGQSVHNDPRHATTSMERVRCNVVVVTAVDATTTLVRQLNINTHAYTRDGFVAPDVEARQFNVLVPPTSCAEDQLSQLAQHIRIVRNAMFRGGMNASLDAAIDAARARPVSSVVAKVPL
ncbi:hypothetical protein SPRG_14638 [Saprolegnia parasitica CBS 223.65]|uniref:BZIP domain-containing protein n=1 Tax=Saprolegnia parasitica (strain CBS 223.65) TaxID=695850 RepID=A0A067BNN4_SAPPC|nr:hypothetical protein SPRG_14638 [Saprolegnia parasitica CBS 223.65]KDO20099.1 hypothetical protein SPRG_14638 [Saprolegnia parasitica CBS 223.65]|eukprot:XP_012209202.1 hypothetical protein SPRG_14638 [Saprolegnia parasitica CBS 223.65]